VTNTLSSVSRRLAYVLAASALLAVLGGSVATTANAEIRFRDGTYARKVLACKSGLGSNMMNEVSYANRAGVWVRWRVYIVHANSHYVNAWTSWSGYVAMRNGTDLGSDSINALPDGEYMFQAQYAKVVGGNWEYVSEYLPVFQYDDGFINESALLWSALPANNRCRLGSQFVITW